MKKHIRKLNLNKRTISNLNIMELNRHVGGDPKVSHHGCSGTCSEGWCTLGCTVTCNGHTCNGNHC